MKWRGRRTGSGVSQKGRPQQAYGNQDLFSQKQTIFSTPKILTRTDKRVGLQGKHAIATIKSALWTTKWLTVVFPWPVQIQFPLQ